MSAKNTGGPAFPAEIACAPTIGGNAQRFVTGMSLRDWFAGKAMQGWLADGVECNPDAAPAIVANAYLMADLMLAERSKP